MTNEYITKSQAIDLAESLRPIAGNGITDAFIKGIEGVEGCRLIKNKEPVDGKTVAIKLSPEIKNTLRGWISVKDRLPKRGERVICYMDFSKFPEYQWENIVTDNVYNGVLVGSNPRKHVWKWQGDYVTHWMPLPEPPKE